MVRTGTICRCGEKRGLRKRTLGSRHVTSDCPECSCSDVLRGLRELSPILEAQGRLLLGEWDAPAET